MSADANDESAARPADDPERARRLVREICDYLRETREEWCLTRETVAAMLQIAPDRLARIEDDAEDLDATVLIRAAQIFGVDLMMPPRKWTVIPPIGQTSDPMREMVEAGRRLQQTGNIVLREEARRRNAVRASRPEE